MCWRIASEPVGKQDILEFLHQHRQHTVGIGDGKRQPFRTSEPHQAIGKPVRVQSRKYSNRRQRNSRNFKGENQKRNNRRSISAKQQRNQEQIPGLRKKRPVQKGKEPVPQPLPEWS